MDFLLGVTELSPSIHAIKDEHASQWLQKPPNISGATPILFFFDHRHRVGMHWRVFGHTRSLTWMIQSMAISSFIERNVKDSLCIHESRSLRKLGIIMWDREKLPRLNLSIKCLFMLL